MCTPSQDLHAIGHANMAGVVSVVHRRVHMSRVGRFDRWRIVFRASRRQGVWKVQRSQRAGQGGCKSMTSQEDRHQPWALQRLSQGMSLTRNAMHTPERTHRTRTVFMLHAIPARRKGMSHASRGRTSDKARCEVGRADAQKGARVVQRVRRGSRTRFNETKHVRQSEWSLDARE